MFKIYSDLFIESSCIWAVWYFQKYTMYIYKDGDVAHRIYMGHRFQERSRTFLTATDHADWLFNQYKIHEYTCIHMSTELHSLVCFHWIIRMELYAIRRSSPACGVHLQYLTVLGLAIALMRSLHNLFSQFLHRVPVLKGRLSPLYFYNTRIQIP